MGLLQNNKDENDRRTRSENNHVGNQSSKRIKMRRTRR